MCYRGVILHKVLMMQQQRHVATTQYTQWKNQLAKNKSGEIELRNQATLQPTIAQTQQLKKKETP